VLVEGRRGGCWWVEKHNCRRTVIRKDFNWIIFNILKIEKIEKKLLVYYELRAPVAHR
jgi:hypothetical protein